MEDPSSSEWRSYPRGDPAVNSMRVNQRGRRKESAGIGFWVNLLTSSPDVGVRVRGPRLLCNQKQEPVLYRLEFV